VSAKSVGRVVKVEKPPQPVLVGYARVSTFDQSLETQVDALKQAGCQRIYAEKYTGGAATGREELTACLKSLSGGEVLVVTKIDRLARSMADLTGIIADLVDRGIGFRCLHQGAVDTTTLTGRLTLNILGAFAEFELQIIAERRAEGIARAKAAGKYKGGKRRIDYDAVRRAAEEEGSRAFLVAKRFGISQGAVYEIAGDIWRRRTWCPPLSAGRRAA
jgi:DNA invertase Pin-like site-specific DNA recombinase